MSLSDYEIVTSTTSELKLKGRVAELEKKLYDSRIEVNRVTTELEESEPEINRLMKQAQELQLQNEKLQSAHNEICVRQSARVAGDILILK